MCTTFIKYFVHSGNIVATEEMFDISAFLLSVSNKKGKLFICPWLLLKSENIILTSMSLKHLAYVLSTFLTKRSKNEPCT